MFAYTSVYSKIETKKCEFYNDKNKDQTWVFIFVTKSLPSKQTQLLREDFSLLPEIC